MSTVTKVTSSKVVSSQTMSTSTVKTMKTSTSTVKKSTMSSDGKTQTSIQQSTAQSSAGHSATTVERQGAAPEEMQKMIESAGPNAQVTQMMSQKASSSKTMESMSSSTSSLSSSRMESMLAGETNGNTTMRQSDKSLIGAENCGLSMSSTSSRSMASASAMSSNCSTSMMQESTQSGSFSSMNSLKERTSMKSESAQSFSSMVSQSSQSFSQSTMSSSAAVNMQNKGFLEGAQQDMDKLKLDTEARMKKLREDFNMISLSDSGSGAIKLDKNNIQQYTDQSGAAGGGSDSYTFNFDVSEMQAETIDVKCDGNKIEVKAKKIKKSGDDDQQEEEFSRTYELPQGSELDPKAVKSSCFQDGVLTVELPSGACQDLKAAK